MAPEPYRPWTWPPCARSTRRGGLDVPDLAPDPVAMFASWMDDTVGRGPARAERDGGGDGVAPTGRPSSRMVLLKGVDERGFVFFTNYDSRKGGELAANPRARCSSRGTTSSARSGSRAPRRRCRPRRARPTSRSRPRESQLGAWASPQSRVVAARRRSTRAYAAACGAVRRARRRARARRTGAAPGRAGRRGVLAGPARAGCTTGWSTAGRDDPHAPWDGGAARAVRAGRLRQARNRL